MLPGGRDDDGSFSDENIYLARMQAASPAQRAALARAHDWQRQSGAVLGWAMAQKTVGLGTALSVFFGGGPERFNYLHKRDVRADFAGAARLLDNICLRVNSGFYLAVAGDLLDDPRRLRKWLAVQQMDRAEGTSGRWVLDEEIVAHALTAGKAAPPAPARPLFGRAGARNGSAVAGR